MLKCGHEIESYSAIFIKCESYTKDQRRDHYKDRERINLSQGEGPQGKLTWHTP